MPKVSKVRRMVFFGLMARLHTGTTQELMDGCKIYAYAQFLRPAGGGVSLSSHFWKGFIKCTVSNKITRARDAEDLF